MSTYVIKKNIPYAKKAAVVQSNQFDEKLYSMTEEMHILIESNMLVGLAAPLIDVDKRIIALNYTDPQTGVKTKLTMINPDVTCLGDQIDDLEACSGLTNHFGYVRRYSTVAVNYQDTQGNKQELRAEGYLARIVQHEYDLLNGIMYTDRLKETNRRTHTNYYTYYLERLIERLKNIVITLLKSKNLAFLGINTASYNAPTNTLQVARKQSNDLKKQVGSVKFNNKSDYCHGRITNCTIS